MSARALGGTVTAVREDVRVDSPIEDAFRLFTDGIGEWWPLEEGYSFGGDRAKEIHLEPRAGGRLYERWIDGHEFEIGRVIECEVPHLIVFTWRNPKWQGATEVEVRFRSEGEGTRVIVEHRAFERLGPEGDGVAARYAGGWPRVLQAFAAWTAEL